MSKHWLARDIALVIAVKVVVILAASFFVFGAKQRPAIDTRAMQERLIFVQPALAAGRGL